jgi:methionyl-tRNA synthetase
MFKKFLITAALPYANGPLHFGHLTGVYIPADIYSRHRRLQGHSVRFISGSDEHGVAIMLAAEKAKLPYREYVDHWHKSHRALFSSLAVDFDFFGRTSEPYHEEETLTWFRDLHAKGLIDKQTERQLYSIDDKKFLPDRFVEGTCYVCGYTEARGDECPNCGEWIDPIRLKNPISKISGSKNIEVRETQNYFLSLTKLEAAYRTEYSKRGHWRKLVRGFVDGMLQQGLIDRCITRDLDWGIRVPLPDADGKRIYVWFDAPIGYVSNLKQFLKESRSKDHYLKDWFKAEDVELSHFIGKDNIVFHALIFPMMSIGTGFIKVANEIPANEFLNLEGKQFSKSAGWYIDAEAAIASFGPDPVRYYLSSVIPETGDTNFTWDTFVANYDELRNKVGNFTHRSLSFIHKSFPEGLSAEAFVAAAKSPELAKVNEKIKKATALLDSIQPVKALAEILSLGQVANEFFQNGAPWKKIKESREAAEILLAESVLYSAAFGFLLEPFVPGIAAKIRGNLGLSLESLGSAYAGDSQGLLQPFLKGLKLPKEPEVSLPQIDPDKIKAWKEQLKA